MGQSDVAAYKIRLWEEVLRLHREATFLESGGGLQVGGAHFDPLLKACVTEEFLTVLDRSGGDITVAAEAARAMGRVVVAKHNARRPREMTWQHWEGVGDSIVTSLVCTLRTFLAAGSE